MRRRPDRRHVEGRSELIQRICSAFQRLPALRLTVHMAEGLFGGSAQAWERILSALAEAGWLVRHEDGTFSRHDANAAADDATVIELTRLYLTAEEGRRRLLRRQATIAHELRRTLLAMSTCVDRATSAGSEGQDVEWHLLRRQVSLGSRLVTDLEEQTAAGRDGFSLYRTVVDLNDILEEALDAGGALLRRPRLEVSVQLAATPIWVDVDRTRLHQALSNLLASALERTPAGGRVCARTSAQDGYAIVRLSDTGREVDPDQLEPGPFEPCAAQALGLSIAREIVEQHGGTIAAQHLGPGRGAEFTVTLPRVQRTNLALG